MAAHAPTGSAASWGRPHVAANLRRALFATVGIAVVVAVEAVPRSMGLNVPPVFVAYSLLIWAAIPAVVTLGVAGAATLAWDVELPMWLAAAVAGLATSAWVSWGIGAPAGWVYGLVLGLGGAGAGAALGARWPVPVPVRVVAAVAIAAAVALLVQLASAGMH